VEPSAIPSRVFAANKQNESSQEETLTLAPAASGTTAETPSQSQQAMTETSLAGGETTTTAQPAAAETPNAVLAANTQSNQQPPVETSPSENTSPFATSANFAKYALKLREQGMAQIPPLTEPTSPRPAIQSYQWKTNIVTSVFWIGLTSIIVTAVLLRFARNSREH
jgi:hypothetical protein